MKDAYYFPHDSNAQYDDKISLLRMEHGWFGYGIYWAIIEKLRDATNYRWSIKAEAGLKHCLSDASTSLEQVSTVLETLKKAELLSIDDDGYLYSKSLTNRMQRIDDRREKLSNAGKIGGKSRINEPKPCLSDAEAMPKRCLSDEQTTLKLSNQIKSKEIKETKKEEKTVFVFEDKSLENGETNLNIETVDDESGCTETVTEQYQSEINSKPEMGKHQNEFMRKGRELRDVKAQPESVTHEERNAETKKRQKVMEWFLKYISIHPKKTKRFLVEQIWCDMFLNPTLSEEGAKELYGKIITALRAQKDKHPRDDSAYTYFPAADAWLRDGRWMDEVETIQPETLEEQGARFKKKFDADEAARKAMYEREGIPFE